MSNNNSSNKNNCRIIAAANQKGGVGKTTTSGLTSELLAEKGKQILAIDLDPQANLTMCLGYTQPDEIELNIARILNFDIENANTGKTLEDVGISENDYIIHTQGFDFIPGSLELSAFENILINTMAISRENVLKRFLSRFKDYYDYIIIDCPPSLNILTINALTACTEVIIPVQPQFLSAKGLEMLLQTISKVKRNLNENLSIAGALITMRDNRSNFHKEVINTVGASYREYINIFESIIPLSVKVSEAQSRGNSILKEKDNKVATAYREFVKELELIV